MEKYFQIMGGSVVGKRQTITTTAFSGVIGTNVRDNVMYNDTITTNTTITLEGSKDIPESVIFLLNGVKVRMLTKHFWGWEVLEESDDKIVYQVIRKGNYQTEFETAIGYNGTTVSLDGFKQTISEGQPVPSYTSSYELEQIDTLREYILGLGREEFKINENSDDILKSLFIWNVFQGNGASVPRENYIKPLIRTELGGLCIKTLQQTYRDWETDRKSTRLNSSHSAKSRMPSSA